MGQMASSNREIYTFCILALRIDVHVAAKGPIIIIIIIFDKLIDWSKMIC